MKTLVAAILSLALLTPALGQDTNQTPVPSDKMEAAGKPFTGTWNGISCQEPSHYGIRFKIKQSKPTEAPTVILLQTLIQGKLELTENEWTTVGFNALIDKRTGTAVTRNLLFITNNTLVVSVVVVNGKMAGVVSTTSGDNTTPLVLAPAGDITLEDFVKTNANLCADPVARRNFFSLPEPR